MKKNDVQPMFLLVGFGVVFSLFLIIVIMKLCDKTKSSKRKLVTEQPCDETTSRGESLNQLICRLFCNTGSKRTKGGSSYPSVDAEYADINEVVEMQAINNSYVTASENPGK